MPYLAAERAGDHRRAGAAAVTAAERATEPGAWWPADVWAHRALWHFERAGMELAAIRAARRIGDIRVAAGDPASARRYYAEAISEARDLGAEREQGLGRSARHGARGARSLRTSPWHASSGGSRSSCSSAGAARPTRSRLPATSWARRRRSDESTSHDASSRSSAPG